ncbi:hypothetical protein F1985_13205 [Akkermansia sp. BIOML-A41]|nr:hypothetical protein F1985_13205 [Akkermansia sp. BIOML-A41]
MTKENHGPYEFLGSMVVNLMNIDKSISYSFLEDELHISRRDVSAMRQGKDLHVYQYVRVISCIMDEIHLEILLNLKSATKLFSVLLASKRPLITELADKLRLKYPLLPTISPCPTMRLEAIRSIIPISCRRYPKSV